jgi:hypothetical protein
MPPSTIVSPAYDRVRSKLDTGDIVLFQGRGFVSHMIRLGTSSRWSHVGMVVKQDEWGTLMLWESQGIQTLTDVLTGTARNGVKLVVLSDRVKTFDGEVSVRRLTGFERDAAMKRKLRAFRNEVRGRPFEKSVLTQIKAALDDGIGLGHNEEDLSSLFCSELIAETYQRLGLLGDELPSAEYVPADFSSEREARLHLLGNARLGKEQKLK